MVSPQITPAKTPWRPPVGTVYVFDPSPLNWLFITWITMEEPNPCGPGRACRQCPRH